MTEKDEMIIIPKWYEMVFQDVDDETITLHNKWRILFEEFDEPYRTKGIELPVEVYERELREFHLSKGYKPEELNEHGEVIALEDALWRFMQVFLPKIEVMHLVKYREEKAVFRLMWDHTVKVEDLFGNRVAYKRAKAKVAALILGRRVPDINAKVFDGLYRSYLTFEYWKQFTLRELKRLEEEEKANPSIPVLTKGRVAQVAKS